ncbi:hypothetical protein GCM10027570_42080 [Streptomonospora sediminis]
MGLLAGARVRLRAVWAIEPGQGQWGHASGESGVSGAGWGVAGFFGFGFLGVRRGAGGQKSAPARVGGGAWVRAGAAVASRRVAQRGSESPPLQGRGIPRRL